MLLAYKDSTCQDKSESGQRLRQGWPLVSGANPVSIGFLLHLSDWRSAAQEV